MSKLATFQRDFMAAVLRAQSVGGIAAQPGFSVYRNTSTKGVLDALATNYPTVSTLLGKELFDAIARGFFDSEPPPSPILAEYGAGFPAFLERHPETQGLPYLPDVARIDRFWTEAHLAIDADTLDPALLAATPPAHLMQLTLPLHSATRFGWFDTPAPTIWCAHRHSAAPDFSRLAWRAEGILLVRKSGMVTGDVIDGTAFRILAGVQMGQTIGEAAIEAATQYPGTDPTTLFARILASGALAAPPAKEGANK